MSAALVSYNCGELNADRAVKCRVSFFLFSPSLHFKVDVTVCKCRSLGVQFSWPEVGSRL